MLCKPDTWRALSANMSDIRAAKSAKQAGVFFAVSMAVALLLGALLSAVATQLLGQIGMWSDYMDEMTGYVALAFLPMMVLMINREKGRSGVRYYAEPTIVALLSLYAATLAVAYVAYTTTRQPKKDEAGAPG